MLSFYLFPTESVSRRYANYRGLVVLVHTLHTFPSSDWANTKNLPFLCFSTVMDVMITAFLLK